MFIARLLLELRLAVKRLLNLIDELVQADIHTPTGTRVVM